MKNFDKYFKRHYNISTIRIEMAYMKLKSPPPEEMAQMMQAQQPQVPQPPAQMQPPPQEAQPPAQPQEVPPPPQTGVM